MDCLKQTIFWIFTIECCSSCLVCVLQGQTALSPLSQADPLYENETLLFPSKPSAPQHLPPFLPSVRRSEKRSVWPLHTAKPPLPSCFISTTLNLSRPSDTPPSNPVHPGPLPERISASLKNILAIFLTFFELQALCLLPPLLCSPVSGRASRWATGQVLNTS